MEAQVEVEAAVLVEEDVVVDGVVGDLVLVELAVEVVEVLAVEEVLEEVLVVRLEVVLEVE